MSAELVVFLKTAAFANDIDVLDEPGGPAYLAGEIGRKMIRLGCPRRRTTLNFVPRCMRSDQADFLNGRLSRSVPVMGTVCSVVVNSVIDMWTGEVPRYQGHQTFQP